MGLTIHYYLRSSARSLKTARELVARLRSRALDLPFERVDDVIELSGPACNYQQYGQDHPNRWLLIQAGQFVADPVYEGLSYSVAPSYVIAFSTWPGQGCEEANYGLCRYPGFIDADDPYAQGRSRKIRTRLSGWSWGSFCKTEYASNSECGGLPNFLRCHLSVIRMLDHAKELGILESVSDEGEFWEKRDVEALAREVGLWNTKLAAWAAQLKDQFGDDMVSAIAKFPDLEHSAAEGRK